MMRIVWNQEKANVLTSDNSRGNTSIEDCVIAIENGRVLADILNPVKQYSHQRMFFLNINAYVVPYVETKDEIIPKTVFPSRKLTAIYITGMKP